MKILVVSGFLGCGKTTFIKELVKRTGKRTAVFENEFGAEGIDADILRNEDTDGKLNIWELTEGCVCCSTNGDFVQSVLTIANTVDPEYLIVEPSGVALLSALMKSLEQIEYERITLLAPLTIIDGANFMYYRQDYEQIFLNQLAAGSHIVFSKTENMSGSEISELKDAVLKINPGAFVYPVHYGALGKEEFWDRILKTHYRGGVIDDGSDQVVSLPDSCSFKNVRMNSPYELILFLEDMIRGSFGSIERSKGILSCGSNILRYDLVNRSYSIAGADEDSDHKAVFIGRELKREKLLRRFERRDLKTVARRKRLSAP